MSQFNKKELYYLLDNNSTINKIKIEGESKTYFTKYFSLDLRQYKIIAAFDDNGDFDLVVEYSDKYNNEFAYHREYCTENVSGVENWHKSPTINHYCMNDDYSFTLHQSLVKDCDGCWYKKFALKDMKNNDAGYFLFDETGKWEVSYKNVLFFKGGLYEIEDKNKTYTFEQICKLKAEILHNFYIDNFNSVNSSEFEDLMNNVVYSVKDEITKENSIWLEHDHKSEFIEFNKNNFNKEKILELFNYNLSRNR